MRLAPLCFAITLLFCIQSLSAQRLQGQAVTWTDFNHIVSSNASLNYVYFATTGGVIRYDKAEQRWDYPLVDIDGFRAEEPRQIWVENFDERIYLETTLGLYELDPLFDSWFPISDLPALESDVKHLPTPSDLLPAPELNHVNGDILIDLYNRNFPITDIIDDNSGDIWLSSWGMGAAVASKSARLMEMLPYGLLQVDARTLFLDDSTLWVSGKVYTSPRSGISRFDLSDNSFEYIESGLSRDFPIVDINRILVDKNYIEIGSSNGLFILDKESGAVARSLTVRDGLFDDEIVALEKMGDTLLIGTIAGLHFMVSPDDSLRYFYPGTFQNIRINDLTFSKPYLWIASDVGAFRYSAKDGKLKQFNDPSGIIFSRVLDIEIYREFVWFSSDQGVVSLNLKSGETTPYRDIHHFGKSRPVAANSKILAFGSDNGIRIYFIGEKPLIDREFTTDDGLASNRVYSLEIDGDYLWIGTDRGLTRFLWNNPDRVD